MISGAACGGLNAILFQVLQIVIDTNVLVAAMRSRRGDSNRLLRHLRDPRWQVNISTALILEYEEVLRRQAAAGAFLLALVEIIVDRFCAVGRENSIFFRWRPFLADADDEFLLELAVRCQCDYLISFDERHLAPAATFGVKVVTPREFLKIMDL